MIDKRPRRRYETIIMIDKESLGTAQTYAEKLKES